MIKHVLDLVELELCTPAAPPMWSIRLQGRKRLVDQPTLERWHSFKSWLSANCFGRVQILLGEYHFKCEWYNQLVIHTVYLRTILDYYMF